MTEDEMPRQIGNLTYTNTTVSFDGKTLIDVNYEHNIGKKFFTTMGNWIVRDDEDNNFYLSNDNVYFVKITMPSEYSGESSKAINKNCDIRCIYEYGDNIIAEFGNLFCTYRLQAPKKDVYYNLDSYVSLPYVIYNDKILAFEQPPVIQDDRTLIPIRFLFEQMGAAVDWDGETRTTAIAQNDRTITFSIDNTTATVNGQPAQMDVPARLISGKTMVPLRFLSENLGYTVDWDGENRIITVGS